MKNFNEIKQRTIYRLTETKSVEESDAATNEIRTEIARATINGDLTTLATIEEGAKETQKILEKRIIVGKIVRAIENVAKDLNKHYAQKLN